eukprot:2590710-Prymnesium_polylepis.1
MGQLRARRDASTGSVAPREGSQLYSSINARRTSRTCTRLSRVPTPHLPRWKHLIPNLARP